MSSKSRQSPGLFVIERFILPNQTHGNVILTSAAYIGYFFVCLHSLEREKHDEAQYAMCLFCLLQATPVPYCSAPLF